MSTPPACSTKPAGEKKLPWHTHMMLTSDFVYLCRNPVMVRPLGPFPVVETHGICKPEAPPSGTFGGVLTTQLVSEEDEGFSTVAQVFSVWLEWGCIFNPSTDLLVFECCC